MSMKSVIQNVNVLAGKRYSMEGNEATNFYCLGEQQSSDSYEGQEIMKIVAPYEALDGVRGQLPGRFDIQVELVQGGKDKMVMKALAMKPVTTPGKSS
ncbi:MAG: hypothetical protein ACKVJE_21520 [Pseudomonadales bacterium]|jgi:hypothetical protein